MRYKKGGTKVDLEEEDGTWYLGYGDSDDPIEADTSYKIKVYGASGGVSGYQDSDAMVMPEPMEGLSMTALSDRISWDSEDHGEGVFLHFDDGNAAVVCHTDDDGNFELSSSWADLLEENSVGLTAWRSEETMHVLPSGLAARAIGSAYATATPGFGAPQ